MRSPREYDAIIVGAGAAGLFCAAVAGQRGRRVLLVDHAAEPGRKILISGGGRCNFTNVGTGPENYLSANPHFAKSALRRYTPGDFIAVVESHGIAWHEKTLGQLFCDGSSKQILAMLLDECGRGGVDKLFGEQASIEHRDGRFDVTVGSAEATSQRLILASGGLSIPKLGATGFAYDVARRFGLKIVEPRPALVPLTLPAGELLFTTLSGVSAEVVASAGRGQFREAALFTHRGLSGPAILQISSYWRHGDPVSVNFLPDAGPGWLRAAKREEPRANLRRVLARSLPDRLAATLSDLLQLQSELGQMSDSALDATERQLAAWNFNPKGSEGFVKAEVTIGGISTDELSSRTMESRRVRGLCDWRSGRRDRLAWRL
jgi:predicted Rossmann fold flavoprotein